MYMNSGFSHKKMMIFHCYVNSPEGISHNHGYKSNLNCTSKNLLVFPFTIFEIRMW